jgi:RNA ligase (TIGR02306 family)
MSEFHVEVTRVRNVQKHPNADTLSIAEVNGYPVIFRTGEYEEGGLAVHVPIDSIVPDRPEWAFLEGHRRIKAKKLRGIFSMGMLTNADPSWVEGQNVQAELGIEKWEPAMPSLVTNTENEADPGFLPVFTDIEGLRRRRDVLQDGEEVVLTEKIHGANARFVYQDGRLWVGSHHQIKKFDERNMWWKVAIEIGLEERLAKVPGIAVYGEVYGQVQDLKYGHPTGAKLILFDALDTRTGRYLDYDAFKAVARGLDLETVPELYRGPWLGFDAMTAYCEGKTTMGADHVREGYVVRPVQERWHHHIGRVIFKMIGEGYMLRKAA